MNGIVNGLSGVAHRGVLVNSLCLLLRPHNARVHCIKQSIVTTLLPIRNGRGDDAAPWHNQSPSLDPRTPTATSAFSNTCRPFLKGSDFDDPHGKDCIFLQATLPVRLNMIEPNNGHAPTTSADKYTGAIILRTRPHTYKRVVRLLSGGGSSNQDCQRLQGHRTLRRGYCEA